MLFLLRRAVLVPLLFSAAVVIAVVTAPVSAAPLVRTATGANAATIQAAVDQFRTDLGGSNNGVGGTFPTGRREINWDGVPNSFAAPNDLPPDFFNTTSPRGVVFHSVLEDNGTALNDFMVSSTMASGVAVRFGDVNPGYSANFATFTSERLFMPRQAHALLLKFYVPDSVAPASVSGFGVVFSDVDTGGSGRSYIAAYDASNQQLVAVAAGVGSLSFVGVSFTEGERIDHVIIKSGTDALSANIDDGDAGVDLVVLDDFIYGEPQPYTDDLFSDGFED